MEAQENTSGGFRPNLLPLQTVGSLQGVSQMPVALVNPACDRGQSSAHSSPLQALPTPPYSSWGARTISIDASSRPVAPSTASAASQISRGQLMTHGGPERRGSTGMVSFPSSVTSSAPMSSNNRPASVVPSDHAQRQPAPQHGLPRHPSQADPDPSTSRRHQTDVQPRAAPAYTPVAQQPVQLQDWQQPFPGGPASVFPHPSRRASVPSHPGAQRHSPQTAMMPDMRYNSASSAIFRQADPTTADNSRHAQTSGTSLSSRPGASAANPYASPHASSPTVPTGHGHPPKQPPTPTNQQHPISQMYSLPPAGGYAQGGQPIQPQQPRIPLQPQKAQPQLQQPGPQPSSSTQTQQQHPRPPFPPQPLPNDHPAVQHSHRVMRSAGLYLERAYNAAIFTISNELDRLDSQFRALSAEYSRVSAMHQQSEQEKTVLREERTKLFGEFVKEREAHERAKADLAKAMDAGTKLMDLIRTRAAEYEKMKTELERSDKINTVLAKSVGERFQSGNASTSEGGNGSETVNMVKVGKWEIPQDLFSVLEDAVRVPLIQQYEQRFGEVLAGQVRERAEHEKALALLRALLPTSLPPQSQDGVSTRTGPVHQTALPTTPHQPSVPTPQPQHIPQHFAHYPQPAPHSQHPAQRQGIQLPAAPQTPLTPQPRSTPTPSTPTPTSDALASRLTSTPLSLGPSLSRRRDHLPLPLSNPQRPASTSADDHNGSIPTPPRTATPSRGVSEPSMFTVVKQEPVDAPNWPWLPGEVIDLTVSTDSPLSANPPPLLFDLGQLEPQPGTESDSMNVDPPQSSTQSAPPDQPERKRSLSTQADSDAGGSRKRPKMDNSEEEEDAVMEELMKQASSEADEPMEATEHDTPLASSPEVLEMEPPIPPTLHTVEPPPSELPKPQTSEPTLDDRTVPPAVEDPAAPLPAPNDDLRAGPPALAGNEGVLTDAGLSHVSVPAVPLDCAGPISTGNGPQTASTPTTFESVVKAEPQDLSSLATALALPPSPKLSIRHLDLVYHTDKDKVAMSCRMCLARKQVDSGWVVQRFSTQAKWAELSGHCKNIHPRAFQELVGMTDAKVTETRQRLITGNR